MYMYMYMHMYMYMYMYMYVYTHTHIYMKVKKTYQRKISVDKPPKCPPSCIQCDAAHIHTYIHTYERNISAYRYPEHTSERIPNATIRLTSKAFLATVHPPLSRHFCFILLTNMREPAPVAHVVQAWKYVHSSGLFSLTTKRCL